MTPAAIGVDIGGTKLVAATVDADGTIIDRRRRTTPANDPALLVETLVALLDELGDDLPIGVGIAGLVTPDGTVRYGPNIAVRDLTLGVRLREHTGRHVSVLNDASAAAFGEQRIGAARGHRHVVLLTLGTGVGGGIVADGALLLGANGFAGELGHVLVQEGGRPCPCGNRGCLEAYASGTAIGLLARDRLVDPTLSTQLRGLQELTGREVTEAAVAGDEVAASVLSEVGHWLGVACASLVNALDPEVVLVGGGAGAAIAPWVLPAARTAMRQRLMGTGWRDAPPIELAGLADDAGMIGAALLAVERAEAEELR